MSLTGEIKSIYRDREQTQPVFPVTKVKAVSDDNGTGLNVLLDNIHAEIDGLTYSDVGAAPAGYGLGESVHYSETVHRMKSVEEMDEVYVCGWSFFYPEKPVILNGISVSYGVLFTTGLNNERACQELYVNNIRFKLVRWRAASGWKEWACEAPPMVAGVEYLTTEWWNGKQIYTMLINYGKGPASGAANLYTQFPGNAVFTELHCRGVQDDGWGHIHDEYLSFGENGAAGIYSVVSITGAGDLSAQNLYLTVKYYKA